jgi:hypothetical protein
VKPHVVFFVIVPLLLCRTASPVSAQTGSPRPYRSIFGGATTNPSLHHDLNMTVSLVGGYDDNLLAQGQGLGAEPSGTAPLAGVFASVAPVISYAWTSKSVQLNAVGSFNLRYYPDGHQFLDSAQTGAFGIAAGSDRTRFSFNQSMSFSPSYFFGLVPQFTDSALGYVVGGDSESAVSTEPVLVYDSAVDVSRRLTSRSTVSAIANFRYSDFSRVANANDLQSYGIGGRFLYSLSRHVALRMGYVYREGQYSYFADAQPQVVHDLDLGVEFRRPLSLSRRTHVDFNVGSSIVNAPRIDPTSGDSPEYRLVGGAGLNHDMGRTWRARVAYDRGVRFIEAIQQPVFSDAFNTALSGFINRRIDLSFTGGFSLGEAGTVTSTQNRVRTYTVSARARMAVNTSLALFSDYTYYNYDFGNRVILVDGVPRSLERNSVRVGLSAWLPIVRK